MAFEHLHTVVCATSAVAEHAIYKIVQCHTVYVIVIPT